MKSFNRVLAFVLCLLLAGSCVFAEEAVLAPEIEMALAEMLPAKEAPAAAENAEATALPDAEPEVSAAPAEEVASEAMPAETTPEAAEPSPGAAPAPEVLPTAEPDAAITVAPSAEETAKPTPEPAAEAGAEAAIEAMPEATIGTSAEPAIDTTPEATAEPTAEAATEATAEPVIEVTAAPAAHPALELDVEELVLGVKEKYTPEICFSDGEKYKLSYTSENTKIAKVDKKGLITPQAVGETIITIESEFGESIELPLTVKKAPYNLKLDTKEVRLGAGQSYQLELQVPEDCAGAIEWVNSKPKVVSVDENGFVTALSKGSAYVRAEAYNGKYASLTVRVYAVPESLHLAEEEVILGVGQPFTLELKEELPEESYNFSSDNPEIAAVNSKGEISALTPGEAVITAESYNGLKDECRITVKPAPEKIAFREKEIILCSRDSYTIQPLQMGDSEGIEVSLKSSTSRYKINGNTITASSTGTGTITATAYNGLTATVQITSIAAPKKVAFRDADITLFMGTDAVPALDVDCSYTLASSDPEIISVHGQRITALKPGDAQVKATTFNKKTAMLNVHVPPLPDSLALHETELALGCGDAYSLHPIIPEGQGSSFHYESSDSAVAAVDAEGRIEALSPGSAVITVRSLNDLRASCTVTVHEAPTAVQLSPARVVRSMEQGAFTLEIIYGGGNQGGRYTIESSNPQVAAVSHDGRVTPAAPGETTITIETYNGLSASTRIILGEKPSAMRFAQDIFVALGDSIPVAPQFDRGCESYSLESVDPAIAAISGDSLTGVSLGTTTLRAVSVSALTAQCGVTVVAPPTGIELSHSEEKLVLSVSPTLQLTGRALPGGVGSIRYESSDPAIASVDENGLVTAHAMGDCVITALTYDGKHGAECIIHVRGVLDGVKIGIDPGHQRKADGRGEAISPTSTRRKARTSHGTSGRATKIPEYETNRVISLRLRDILEAHGAEVHMTHHDVNISNQERAKMMNELGVDLVLRIHCNSASRSSVKGMSNYVRKTGACKEESVRAAQLILDEMLAETGAVNQGVKESDEYTGLNWSTVPSILMELGYMSNRAEDVLLNTPEYQDKMIIGIVRGICAYKNRSAPEIIIPESLLSA